MPSVETSAKTRKDAIQLALEQLGVEMHEVDEIEMLDEGSRGFLGIGARPVRVRVTAKRGKLRPASDERHADRTDRQPRGPRDDRGRGPREDRRDGNQRRERVDRQPRRDREERPAAAQRDDRRGGQDREGRPAAEQRDSRQDGHGRDNRQGGRGRDNRQGGRGRDGRPGGRDRDHRQRGRDREDRPRADARPQPRAGAEAPIEGDVFEGKEAFQEIEATPLSEDQGREAAALLQSIVTKMGFAAEVAFRRDQDEAARLDVKTEDGALLIGRKGRNLQAMQYLINRIVARGDKNDVTERLVVDIEGYVDRRRESLEALARDLAARAKEQGRDVRVKPLSPQERRVIHLTLQDDPDVRTFSFGDALYRQLVISPRNKQASQSRAPQEAHAAHGAHPSRGGVKRRATGRLMRPRPTNMRRSSAPQGSTPSDSGATGGDAST